MGLPDLRRHHWRLAVAAALLITAYGGLLRLDAFVGKYGTLDRPAWARVMTHDVAPLVRHVRPAGVAWGRVAEPYVGGDPINYLAFGREMRSFYQPHVREPVFLAFTRMALWSLDDQDAAVSLASAAGSLLAIFATFLLGAAVISPAGGLACALILAIEYEAIIWSVDGWRDDTFMAFTVLAAWALVRLRARASPGNALLAGVLGAAVCLTRITAISFVLPALVWIVLDGPRPEIRLRARQAGLACLVLAVLVAPYLISCAITFGDPLVAINHHTGYYRYADGFPSKEPMSVGDYLRIKFARSPVATIDTGFMGLFVQPFITKGSGLNIWLDHLGMMLRLAALPGLAAWLFTRTGRLLLVVLLASLVPYAFTWNVGGGGEWRFTMHVYSIYIVAAVYAVAGVLRAAVTMARTRPVLDRRTWRTLAARAAIVSGVSAVGAALYFGLPWFVVREAIASGESTSVETGPRDRIFFADGWTATHGGGNVTVRVNRADRATLWFPLPEKRAYDLVLRLDPVAPAAAQRVSVLLNHQLVGHLRLTWDPERVGSYRIPLPEWVVQEGRNELTLAPDFSIPASEAGPQFAWIDPDEKIGVRLWYVRVLP